MKKIKRTFAIVLILALGLMVSFFGGMFFKNWHGPGSTTTITSDILAGKLAEISELASLEYRYTNVGKFENQRDFYGWKVPLTTKRFIYTYDGVIKMGIKGQDLSVKIEDNKIIVSVPPAEILSHEIKEDTIEVYDQTKNIFNQIRIEDMATFSADRKKAMEEKIMDEGSLLEAGSKAEQQIRVFIENLIEADDNLTEVIFERKSK